MPHLDTRTPGFAKLDFNSKRGQRLRGRIDTPTGQKTLIQVATLQVC